MKWFKKKCNWLGKGHWESLIYVPSLLSSPFSGNKDRLKFYSFNYFHSLYFSCLIMYLMLMSYLNIWFLNINTMSIFEYRTGLSFLTEVIHYVTLLIPFFAEGSTHTYILSIMHCRYSKMFSKHLFLILNKS